MSASRSAPEYSRGLEGVIAGETALSCVEQGKLLYRGYPIEELAEKTTFEEVAYLLLYGDLPNRSQLSDFRRRLDGYRGLAPDLVETLRRIPRDVPMMDALRTGVSMAGHFDPVSGDDLAAWQERSVWLTAQIAGIIGARFRLVNGREPVEPRAGLSHAGQILYLCHGTEPEETAAKLLDLTLVLYAEHEFNASTFTARVIISTLSDLVSAVVGAIGALKGPLHGGANEAAMKMLQRFRSPEEAERWTREALGRKEKISGFGHRVYKHGDHRARILDAKMRELAAKLGKTEWVAIYDAVRNVVEGEKKIYMNVDYPCGLTYFLLGLPVDVYTPLFVASRVTGWAAHCIEQYFNNRLYRPRSWYTGPEERPVKPIDER